MKKCLLFIFTFGIIFSLYNIKAFAYSYSDFDYISVCKISTKYRLVGEFHGTYGVNINNGIIKYRDMTPYFIPYFISQTYFDTVDDALSYLSTSTDLQKRYQCTDNIYELVTVKGYTYINNNDGTGDIYQSYDDYLEATNPIDISMCAFFFESDPTTSLYSMYCFPQELDDNEVVTIYYNNLNNIGFEITSASVDTLKRCYLESGSNIEYYHSIEYWLEMIDQVKLENDNVIDFLFTTPIYAIYCDFIENNENPNYNIFPLTENTWWDDIVNEIGFEDTELGFIWEWLFGDPDPDYHNVTIDNSPSPTPLPTPIPYRTTLVPDGNGGYDIQYEYEDENGNQITASAPPNQPKYNSDALITQPVNINISGVPISDVDGVQSLLNVIGNADTDYQEGFKVIGKSFATLPSKWFMFFGIPAAIILIAGIIKSLLG